jgi:hypothetical protein
MAGTNILCTESFLASNFALKSGKSSNWDNTRMLSVSEILPKYQVTVSGNNDSARRPRQNEIVAVTGATNWQAHTMPYNMTGVAYGNGQFIAITNNGGAGSIWTSVDGNYWASQLIGNTYNWYSIAYGNGTWVAVDNTSRCMTSTNDGLSWTVRTASNQSGTIPGIVFCNGYFELSYAAGNWNGRSTDGITWNSSSGGNASWFDTAYGNSKYVKVGIANGSQFKSSTDGLNFSALQNQTSMKNPYTSIAYGAGIFVAVVDYQSTYYYPSLVGNLTSPDGVTWTLRSKISSPFDPVMLRYGNGTFVCVGTNSYYYQTIAISTDGINWTLQGISLSALNAVAYGNGLWVAVGNGNVAWADG